MIEYEVSFKGLNVYYPVESGMHLCTKQSQAAAASFCTARCCHTRVLPPWWAQRTVMGHI